MRRKPSETVQLKLRFPERLRVRIEAEAEKSERSMNAEIVHRLEQSFEGDDRGALVKTVASEAAQTASRLMMKHVLSLLNRKEQRTAKPQTAVTANAASADVFQPGVRKR
jgi:hypothetical protein